MPYGPQRTRIDRKIEDGEVETGRQFVGAHRIPIEAPIDRDGLLPGQVAHILHGDGTPPRPGQRLAGDAEIGRPARIARMMHEAALMLQHELDGILELRWERGHGRSSQFRLQGDEGLAAEMQIPDGAGRRR